MRTNIFAILTALTLGLPNFAVAAPAAVSCKEHSSSVHNYRVWKSDFEKFRVEGAAQSEGSQFISASQNLRTLVEIARGMTAKSKNASILKLIKQSEDFLYDLHSGYFAAGFAIREMKSFMSKLEEPMDELAQHSEVLTASCQIESAPAFAAGPTVIPAAAE